MASVLEELSKSVTDVVAAARASVVGVGRSGSGVVVSEGLVVTNAHNLWGELTVSFDDGTVATATVAGADPDGDLAVLSVGTGGAPALQWSARPAAIGQLVVGLSRPGGRGLRAGVGFVSGLGLAFRGPGGRSVPGALEHTATLARGSSGGPLVSSDGRLAGINTHRLGDGAYMALPAGEDLETRVGALARGEVPRRARLGVALAPSAVARRLRSAVGLPEREGVLVHEVERGGPADRAGTRRGDLIISVNGQLVGTAEELSSLLQSVADAGSVDLGVVRGMDELVVAVTFAGPGTAEEGGA
jgi:serine protease Do